jgi:hypothetical protein
MTAFHLSSRRSYTRVVVSSKMSTRFEAGRGVRRDFVGVETEAAGEGEGEGGDHAMREPRRSCDDGNAILRTSSKVIRHRICRRELERHATCVALGDGTEIDVAGAL